MFLHYQRLHSLNHTIECCQLKFIHHYCAISTYFINIYLILFGSIAAYTAYIWLLQVRSSSQVSTYAYVNPVIAVLLGVFFAAEKISLLQILGLIIILTSVLLINLARYRVSRK